MAEADAVRTFYAGERDKLRQKVGGSAEHAAKEKSCEVELYGPVGGALDRAMEQQLEERLRERNPAHRRIEDNEDAIGKANVDKLEKQADEVALASYVVNVRMPTLKRDLDAALADASGVKKTLERELEDANAVIADANAPKGKKQTAEKRKASASAALASLDQEVTQARALTDELERRNDASKKAYEKALDELEDALEAKAKAEPAPATAKK
jgi:DNA repair exonuclease SbcCD ATPase subunit